MMDRSNWFISELENEWKNDGDSILSNEHHITRVWSKIMHWSKMSIPSYLLRLRQEIRVRVLTHQKLYKVILEIKRRKQKEN
jgi:hypothetical protein